MFVTYRDPARLAGMLIALVFGLLLAPAFAQPETVEFDIPAQNLEEALIQFGRQSRQELFYEDNDVVGLTSNPVVGEMTRVEAMRALLAGTGLEFERTDSGGMMVGTRATLDAQRPTSSVAGQNTVGQRRKGIEEIIVTGQKREERIQDVPIAISAFTQEDLTTSQIAGGPDLHLQVPNMTFTKTNFSGYSIQIRGIGTQAISATTDPAVAVALNQTPFIRNRFFEQEFYDMERVEVLRGPQGTLFGRNATAGVVNLVTAKPKFQHESMLSLDVGNYNSRRWEGMVNVPLVDDAVAFRLAAAGTKRDGYATNEITGNPIDGRDLWSTRASLRIAPTGGRFDMNLIWEHFEEEDDRLRSGKQLCKKDVISQVGDVPVTYFQAVPDVGQLGGIISNVQSVFSQGCERNSLYAEDSFQTPNGMSIPYYFQPGAIGLPRAQADPYVEAVQSSDLRVIESTVDPEYRAKTDIGQLQISYELTDSLILDSETAYLTDSIFSLQDFNRFNTARGAWEQPDAVVREGVLQEGSEGGIFCDPQIGCSDRLVAVGLSTAESEQFSQELRLSSQFDGPFNFSLGANVLRYDTEDKYYVFVNSLSLLAAVRPTNGSPYVAGESDNSECLVNWLSPQDPNRVYGVVGCVYIDPNPIGSLNDKGHNYFLSRNPYELRSYAVFGETYWNVADNLKLTAGLRWSVDKKKAPRIPTWLLATQSYDLPVAEVLDLTWREPTGRLVLDWKPNLDFTDETLIYGSYSRGYKAGGANPPTFVYACYACGDAALGLRDASATRPKTFDAEFVNAYEVGTKNTLADGAVTLNAAAFYYDYQGYQISEIVDRSAFNRNFDAEVWGAELEADWWVTEALRLGFKGGYQQTRIRDGEKAVDLMDRTAGKEGWSVVRPFPTFASNCILPTELYTPGGEIFGLGSPNGGGIGGCEYAYVLGVDPVTWLPYEPFPTESAGGGLSAWESRGGDYPGFDPSTAPNNGEGFFKDLGGNELPNAPRFTTTFKVDYTVPLGGDWLMTAHADVYWQDESWWRVFNDHEYNRLDEYFTMNLAAIFTNDVSGWNIMAYVKNVTDEDAITGAFLGSDDTGLTTNAFLVEPQLFGIRVTKRWDGGGPSEWLGSAGSALLGTQAGEPSPLSLTLGGQLVNVDAPYQNLIPAPTFADAFAPPLNAFGEPQNEDLSWGDSREIELGWRPDGGPWVFSAGIRQGKANGDNHIRIEDETEPACLFAPPFDPACDPDHFFWGLFLDDRHRPMLDETRVNWLEAEVDNREEYRLIDLAASRDVPLFGLTRSVFGIGLRHARFESETAADFLGIPDWDNLESSWNPFFATDPITHTRRRSTIDTRREFKGVGPTVSWEAAYSLLGDGDSGRLDLEWSATAGVLFGERETTVTGVETETSVDIEPSVDTSGESVRYFVLNVGDLETERSSFRHERNDSATVPLFEAELGLSYEIGGASIGAGYRWERYFDVVDAGFDQRKEYDRTIDGPYLNVTFGR